MKGRRPKPTKLKMEVFGENTITLNCDSLDDQCLQFTYGITWAKRKENKLLNCLARYFEEAWKVQTHKQAPSAGRDRLEINLSEFSIDDLAGAATCFKCLAITFNKNGHASSAMFCRRLADAIDDAEPSSPWAGYA